jgi:hypothetical protein
MTNVSTRAKKLGTISKEIAAFLAIETHTDEQDVQEYLAKAIKWLSKATGIVISNDEKADEVARP